TLGRDLALDTRDLGITDAAGLLHDIGRFPQYSTHKTFVDSVSVNHAELGARVLKENLVLRKFSQREQERILTAIRYHNRAVLPADRDRKVHLLSRMLRDADKLDIWRVFTEHNKLSKDARNNTVDQDLPDGDSCSEKALADIMARKLVDYRHIVSKNDFALMRLAWVYDVNFTHTFREILARNYLQTLHLTLPQNDKIKVAFEAALTYVEQRAAGL
ncbi:MAG: HD domain-containing protein, partial [Proteobacteria bacterium]|nr:HD domain-containing protein [Pseudomonadota bacterium]